MTNKNNKWATIAQIKKKWQVDKNRRLAATTLSWIDVSEICPNHIVLKRNKVIEHVVGIKLEPKNIFMEEEATQKREVFRVRQVLNKMSNIELFHGYVHNPINLDEHIVTLIREMEGTEDSAIRELIQEEINKFHWFGQNQMELEFFIFIKGSPGAKLDKAINELKNEYARAGFNPSLLNSIDFENYLAYYFENPLVNEYLLSRGPFGYEEDEEEDELSNE